MYLQVHHLNYQEYKNGVSKSINGNYENNINLVNSTQKNVHTKNNITIESSDNEINSIDLIYNFDTTTDLSKIGIMQFEFEVDEQNITIGEFINNILQKIHIGEGNLINKNFCLFINL